MAEMLEETQGLESTTIGIYRTAATVKGGRRFSFSALVVVGDRNGSVGLGYGKAPGVPAAIEKAQKSARKNMVKVVLEEKTVPHTVEGQFGASSIRLIPGSPGTGVIAGATARAVLELAGVQDCLSKAFGSTNNKNLSRATLEALKNLRSKGQVEELRGVTIGKTIVEEKLEAGHATLSALKAKAEAKARALAAAAAEAGETATAVEEAPAAPTEEAPAASAEEAPTAEAPEAEAPKTDESSES